MSFQLSPEAVLFSINSQINSLKVLIQDEQERFSNSIPPEPDIALQEFTELRFNPATFSNQSVISTREIIINQDEF